MKNGAEFERLVHEYYDRQKVRYGSSATISLGAWVEGPDGGRQCDITIDHHHIGIQYRTLVECKDYAGRVPVMYVDALASKLSDLKFNKGIIVSRSGFQLGAIKKASRLGIELHTFMESKNDVSKLKPDLPILHLVLDVSELSLTFNTHPDILPTHSIITQKLSQETDVGDFIVEWIRPDTRLLSGVGHKFIRPSRPMSLQACTDEGAMILITDHFMKDIDVYVRFSTKAYLGTLEQVESYYVRSIQGSEEWDGYIPSDAIERLIDTLPFYKDEGDIPEYLFRGGFVTYSLKIADRYERVGFFELEHQREQFNSRFGKLIAPRGKWLSVHRPM